MYKLEDLCALTVSFEAPCVSRCVYALCTARSVLSVYGVLCCLLRDVCAWWPCFACTLGAEIGAWITRFVMWAVRAMCVVLCSVCVVCAVGILCIACRVVCVCGLCCVSACV